MIHHFITGAAALSLLLIADVAGAGTVQKLSLEQLATQAEVIVRGRVADIKPRPSRDGGFAWTRVFISVEEQFKGEKVAALVIDLPVGPVGGVVQGSPGTPEFSAEEEVVLFLRQQRKDEIFRLVGGQQGKFTVRADPVGNRKLVEDLSRRTEIYDDFVARLAKSLKPSR